MEVNSKSNKSLVYLEGMVSNIVTLGIQSFTLTALAMYFNCTPFWLSIMSSLPIAAQVFQIFMGRFYKIFKTRKKALVYSSLLGRIPFLMIPIAIIFDIKKSYILIFSVVMFSLFNSFNLSVWTASIRDMIPLKERAKFFSKRFVIISLTSILFSYFGGKVLDLPNKKVGMTLLTLFIAGASIVSVMLFMMEKIPESSNDISKIDLQLPFKNKNFKNFLIFIGVWNFTLEFSKPYFSYFTAVQLKVPYEFLGVMSAVVGILSIATYPFMGRIGEKFGNKKILSRGIVMSTYAVFCYFVMTDTHFKSLLLFDAIATSFAWSAINLSLFNLLLEVADDPIDTYVSTYYLVVGVTGLIGGVIGGFIGGLIKDITFQIVGDTFYGIQMMFITAILMRLYCILLLTRVESFEKPIYYKGISLDSLNPFRGKK